MCDSLEDVVRNTVDPVGAFTRSQFNDLPGGTEALSQINAASETPEAKAIAAVVAIAASIYFTGGTATAAMGSEAGSVGAGTMGTTLTSAEIATGVEAGVISADAGAAMSAALATDGGLVAGAGAGTSAAAGASLVPLTPTMVTSAGTVASVQAGTAAATQAGGIAGMLGMDAGVYASAVNGAALNGGLTAATGGDGRAILNSAASGAVAGGVGAATGNNTAGAIAGVLAGTALNGATGGNSSTGSVSASNSAPATLANNIANQTWADWNGTEKKALQATVDANAQRGNALYDSSLANSQSQLALSKQMQGDYNTIYRPAGQQYANYVNQLGTQAYQDQQRGIAMGDVQQQIDGQQGQMQRMLQRQGVNPSSGRSLAMNNQNSIMGAAAKAQAAGMSDRNVKADWSKGLTTMASMGNDNLRASQGLDSSAQGWATSGLNAGNTAYTQGMGMSQMGLAQAAGASTAAGRAGDIINGVSASNRADAAANPWTTVGGAALGYLGSDLAKNGKTSAVGSAFDWLTSPSTT